MNSKLIVVSLVVMLMISMFAVPMVSAITYGEPDGDDHPNVGMLALDSEGEKIGFCTGTLISSTVVLTAGHCLELLPLYGISEVWVTFDPEFDSETSTFYPGIYFIHPGYGHDFARLNDLAVVVLDDAVEGVMPALLPPAGFFDSLGPQGLRDQEFTAVGYGDIEPVIGGGPMIFFGFGVRRAAVSSFSALNPNWLRLSQNNATGDGGTCSGDSGGPNFFGSGDTETSMVAAVTSTGDAMCRARNDVYRLDTESARDFLGEFVSLP